MPRPIEALIHAEALRHNLERARKASAGAKIWAVVKADAYGHGIERVFDAFRAADGFALLDLDEAERIRRLGWRGPVLLLEGAFEPRDLEVCSRLKLWHVVHRDEQIDWLAGHETSHPQRVFLKLNSGMNRLGFAPAAFAAAWQRLAALPQAAEVGLMTHFANADAEGSAPGINEGFADATVGIAQQIAVFEEVAQDLPGQRSLCNSAALLKQATRIEGERLADDWVRCGIMLYGSSPDFPVHTIEDWDLMPAMTLRTRLIAVQAIDAAAAVGYGSRFVADAPMRIGIAACGYADGYPRHAETGTPVLVDGVRTRTLGRVSMDMLAVDLSKLPAAHPGSEVTLWGRGPDGSVLAIDEVAHAAGTIGYELMCALAPRVRVVEA